MGAAEAEFFKDVSSDIPLPNAYKVTVANLDQFDKTVEELNGLEHVDIIRENKDLAQKLVAIRQGISVIAIVIVAVLFLISLFIISNTIKLTVYSRRLEISIITGTCMGTLRAGNYAVRRFICRIETQCNYICRLCTSYAGCIYSYRYCLRCRRLSRNDEKVS